MYEQEKLRFEYLLADFRAIKDEIARRPNLQKGNLMALVGFNALQRPQGQSDVICGKIIAL
jgi:hypothetical protein